MVGQWLELLLLERRRAGPGVDKEQGAQQYPGPRLWTVGTGTGQRGHPWVSKAARAQASCLSSTPSFSTYWVQGPGGGVYPCQGRGQDDSPQ